MKQVIRFTFNINIRKEIIRPLTIKSFNYSFTRDVQLKAYKREDFIYSECTLIML